MTHTAISEYKKLPAIANIVNWDSATAKQKTIAQARKNVITEVERLRAKHSFHQAYKTFISMVAAQQFEQSILNALKVLGNKVPSANTVKSWIDAFTSKGMLGLLPKHKGSSRVDKGWEHLALELYHRPQKPSIKKVARQLREDYNFVDATDHNVWYFFSQLPADLGEKSRWRIGTKLYRDGQRTFISRHTENMNVGDVYQGDGHTLDVYLKHPTAGKLWRAELTVFQDMKSRYIVGWYLSSAESSVTTMAALSHGLGTYNHVPLLLYIDNGCGFKSKLMNDDTAGFYNNFGMDVIFAIPGNAKAKGNVERFFRVMEEDLNKDFDTYCGKDMSPDVARFFSSAKMHIMEQKGIHVPTMQEWCTAFENWLIKYHNRPHPEYKNTTPAAMWAQLERTPVYDMNLLVKPRAKVNVRRGSITHQGRVYQSEFLHQFNGQELIAEYDLHNDSSMRIFDAESSYLTTVELKHKRAAIPDSRLDEQRERARIAANKRLQNKINENNDRYLPVSGAHAEQVKNIEALDLPEVNEKLDVKEPNFDLNDFSSSSLFNSPENDTELNLFDITQG